jgi:hypothetical protein
MNSPRPEFISLPADGASCPITGFKRGTLYNLVVPCKANGFKPAVPAKCLRSRGATRGVWLIPYDPLMAFLHALPTPGLKQEGGK